MSLQAGQTVRVVDASNPRKYKKWPLVEGAAAEIKRVTPCGNVQLKGVDGLFKPHRFA